MSTDLLTVHVLIEGRVQGVGYRAWCAEAAAARDLAGWVRNLQTGAVEAVFSGTQDNVSDMLDVVWSGPRFARVTAVRDLEPVSRPGGGFEVRETS